MGDINVWAVLVAAVSSFFLGGLWYSPALFGAVWSREAGRVGKQPGHPGRVFALAFVFALISAAAFAHWLGPDAGPAESVVRGLIVGSCFVAAGFGINYQFADRSLLMLLIDGGYHTAQFGLYGLVLGLWR